MISLDKCNGSYNAVNVLCTKIYVLSEAKDVNMITRINKSETLVKHISCDYKCKFDSTTYTFN